MKERREEGVGPMGQAEERSADQGLGGEASTVGGTTTTTSGIRFLFFTKVCFFVCCWANYVSLQCSSHGFPCNVS